MKKKTEARSKLAASRKSVTKKKPAAKATKLVTRTPRKTAKAVPASNTMPSMAAPKQPSTPVAEAVLRPAAPGRTRPHAAGRRVPHVTRVATASAAVAQHRQVVRMARVSQFTYMKAPGVADAFDVGDTVEVFCDHERNSERVRGWIKGIVVQVDNKLVAVQFRSNVYLTDGWMVPDRILWYSLTSDQIRPATFAKRGGQKAIPDY
ncbi:MAG TPA: hypothetical protein VF784_10055 [Anaerolineales bacterium]